MARVDDETNEANIQIKRQELHNEINKVWFYHDFTDPMDKIEII